MERDAARQPAAGVLQEQRVEPRLEPRLIGVELGAGRRRARLDVDVAGLEPSPPHASRIGRRVRAVASARAALADPIAQGRHAHQLQEDLRIALIERDARLIERSRRLLGRRVDER